MNVYKIRYILDFIRRQGKLPTDRWGQTLNGDDLLVWFGLHKHLTKEEQFQIKQELSAMTEAEMVVDQIKTEMS